MSRWAKYVGIPYKFGSYDPEKGLFCWSLVRWILSAEFGKELPKIPWGARREVTRSGAERFIGGIDCRRVMNPRAGDVAQMQGRRGMEWGPFHVGVYIDRGRILHIENEANPSHIARMDRGDMPCRFQAAFRVA